MNDGNPGGALKDIAPYATSAMPATEEGAPEGSLHLRYDDSRPRGLASECVCGEPGCTRWYDDMPTWDTRGRRLPKQHLVRCPICRELFNQRQIEKHMAAKHPQIKHPKGKT